MTEVASPGWFADPTGKFRLRYWNGAGWTDQVADGDAATTDPTGVPSASASTQVKLSDADWEELRFGVLAAAYFVTTLDQAGFTDAETKGFGRGLGIAQALADMQRSEIVTRLLPDILDHAYEIQTRFRADDRDIVTNLEAAVTVADRTAPAEAHRYKTLLYVVAWNVFQAHISSLKRSKRHDAVSAAQDLIQAFNIIIDYDPSEIESMM